MMLSTVLCLVFYFLSFSPFSFIIFNARHLLYRISSLFAYAPHRTHARHFRNRIQHPQHTVPPLVVPIPNAIINIVLPPCFLPSTIIIHHCRHRHLPQLFFTLSSQPARFFPPATDTVALNHVYLISPPQTSHWHCFLRPAARKYLNAPRTLTTHSHYFFLLPAQTPYLQAPRLPWLGRV